MRTQADVERMEAETQRRAQTPQKAMKTFSAINLLGNERKKLSQTETFERTLTGPESEGIHVRHQSRK